MNRNGDYYSYHSVHYRVLTGAYSIINTSLVQAITSTCVVVVVVDAVAGVVVVFSVVAAVLYNDAKS